MDKPGYYLDYHYTDYFPDLVHMVKEGRVRELEMLLWSLIQTMEAECAAEQLSRPRVLHDVLLTVLRLRCASYREQAELLKSYLRYPILTEQSRAWAENELERVRGKLVAQWES